MNRFPAPGGGAADRQPAACIGRSARRCPRAAAWLLAIALGSSGLLAGCGVFGPRFETPDLDVVGLELLESSFFEQRVRVRMKVKNPNERELPVRGVNADLELAGERFASGVSGAQFTVPAFGETEFDMVVSGNIAGALLRLLGSERRRKEIDYRFSGKVRLASGLFRSIPFDEKGSLRLE